MSKRLGGCWGGEQQNKFVQLFFVFVPQLELAADDDIVSPTRPLRDFATKDTVKPETQSVSEPESLHSCALS